MCACVRVPVCLCACVPVCLCLCLFYTQLDDMDEALKTKKAEATELSKHLAGLQELADDLHAECEALLQRDTRIVAIESNTMSQEVSSCPEDTAEYRSVTPQTPHPSPLRHQPSILSSKP